MNSSESRSDPRRQKLVRARAPNIEGGLVTLVVDVETLRSTVRLKNGQNDKLGQYCGLVHGNVWGLSADPAHAGEGTPGLTQPTAIFAGLKRARNHSPDDNNTHVYVTNPGRNYVYPPADRFSGVGPTRALVPVNAVFVAYVDFDSGRVDAVLTGMSYNPGYAVSGVVADWEWVVASPRDPRLPADSNTRYARKIWDERD